MKKLLSFAAVMVLAVIALFIPEAGVAASLPPLAPTIGAETMLLHAPHFVGFGLLANSDALAAIAENIQVIFNKVKSEIKPTWQKVATYLKSSGQAELYKWFGDLPKMREWVGDKRIKSLGLYVYKILNIAHESTFSVHKHEIDDGALGGVALLADAHSKAAQRFPDQLVYGALRDAMTTECYDGQFFVDTDHPVGDEAGTLYSNKLTIALSNATLALAKGSYGTARQMIMEFKDSEGEPMGLTPGLLVVPPALETVGRMLLENDKLADGTPNPYKGTAELHVEPRLAGDPTAWYLLVINEALMPIIYQEREAPTLYSSTDPNSAEVIKTGEFIFSAEARGAGVYTLPPLIVGGKP